MNTRWALVALLALGAGCAHDMNKHDDESDEGTEVEMALDQVPAPVRATLKREAGGAAITTVDKETRHGQTIYETDVMSDGKNWEIKVDENGRLLGKKLDEEEKEKSPKTDDDEKEEKEKG